MTKYRTRDWSYEQIASTTAELKKMLIDRLSARISWAEVRGIAPLFWLFDAPKTGIEDTTTLLPGFEEIIKVFEGKGRRLALIKSTEINYSCYSSYYNREADGKKTYWYVQSFSPRDEEYDYVDAGRQIHNSIWICDELKGKLSDKEMDVIARVSQEHSFFLLDQKHYGELKNRVRLEMLSARRSDEESHAQTSFKNQLDKDYKAGKTITRNGVMYSQTQIELESFVIRGPGIQNYVEKEQLLTSEGTSFRSIYEGYVDHVLELKTNTNYRTNEVMVSVCRTDPATVHVGPICINIVPKKSKCEDEHYGKKAAYLYYINGQKIPKDEIRDVMNAALCFRTQAEYDAFVLSAHEIPLKMQNIIRNGMDVDVFLNVTDYRDRLHDNDLIKKSVHLYLNLKVVRKSHYCLVFEDKEYKIKSIGDFLMLGKPHNPDAPYEAFGNRMNRFCTLLMRSVEIPPNMVGKMIETGKIRYLEMIENRVRIEKARLENSKEFVQNAIRLTAAVEKEIHIEEGGRSLKGWKLRSVSGQDYFVSNEGKVYAWKGKELEYLCIVDDNRVNTEYEKNDAIAKRLLALHNDKKSALEIYTLDNFMRKMAVA